LKKETRGGEKRLFSALKKEEKKKERLISANSWPRSMGMKNWIKGRKRWGKGFSV